MIRWQPRPNGIGEEAAALPDLWRGLGHGFFQAKILPVQAFVI
jgi:hypothetical protein